MAINPPTHLWLVDAENFLARLLRLKLDPNLVILRRLAPAEFNTQLLAPTAVNHNDTIMISLPVHGVSSRDVLYHVRRLFPHILRIILLFETDSILPALRFSPADEHVFIKPILDWTPVLDVIGHG